MRKIVILILTALLSVAVQAGSIQEPENMIKISENNIEVSENNIKMLEKQLKHTDYLTLCDGLDKQEVMNNNLSNGQIDTQEEKKCKYYLRKPIQRRIIAEQRKITAEQRKITAEQRKITAEERKITAEERKITAEQRKITAEKDKIIKKLSELQNLLKTK